MNKKFSTQLLLLAMLLFCGGQWARAQEVAMFIGADEVSDIQDDDEKAAAQWFNTNYVATGEGKFFTPATIETLSAADTKVLWVAIDREGLEKGYNNLPSTFYNFDSYDAIQNFVKVGGNLLLTGHATQLLVAIERVTDAYAPGIFGSGAGSDNPDIWGINAQIGAVMTDVYDHRTHQSYTTGWRPTPQPTTTMNSSP